MSKITCSGHALVVVDDADDMVVVDDDEDKECDNDEGGVMTAVSDKGGDSNVLAASGTYLTTFRKCSANRTI